MEKRILVAACVTVAFIAVILTSGCINGGPPEKNDSVQDPLLYTFDQADNNQIRQVPLDANISLTLPENPGYIWLLSLPPGIVLENESSIRNCSDHPRPGDCYIWRMKAVQPGNQVISTSCARPPGVNMTDTCSFRITLDVGAIPMPSGYPTSHIYTDADNGRVVNSSVGDLVILHIYTYPYCSPLWGNFDSSSGLKLVSDRHILTAKVVEEKCGIIRSITYEVVQAGNQTIHGQGYNRHDYNLYVRVVS